LKTVKSEQRVAAGEKGRGPPFDGGCLKTIGFVVRAFGKSSGVENLENRLGHYGRSEKRKGCHAMPVKLTSASKFTAFPMNSASRDIEINAATWSTL